MVMTSIVIMKSVVREEEKKIFLEAGETWWNESNRLLPISIFLREEMLQFKHTLVTHNTKEVKVLSGHIVNLSSMRTRRVKRRTLTLVRRMK